MAVQPGEGTTARLLPLPLWLRPQGALSSQPFRAEPRDGKQPFACSSSLSAEQPGWSAPAQTAGSASPAGWSRVHGVLETSTLHLRVPFLRELNSLVARKM